MSGTEAVAQELNESLHRYISDLDGVEPEELVAELLSVINDFVTDVPVTTVRIYRWEDGNTVFVHNED